jgi:hypothetical protein
MQHEVAHTYGVPRRWVITLVQRYLAEGEPGLVPRSRRPRSSPKRTAQAVEDEIIALRKELDRGGHEAGPRRRLETKLTGMRASCADRRL